MKKLFFTLIELLVVISVIAILAGLILPAVKNSADQSKKTKCMNNLKQIGILVNGYVSAYNGRLPTAVRIGADENDPLSIPNILSPDSKKIFECPADTKEKYDAKTYAKRYGTSYEWDIWFNDRKIEEIRIQISGQKYLTPLLGDAEDFHGKLGKNYLYSDGRVTRKLEDPNN
ncbi:MAG: hypothetical protein A2020_13805 [Lentisphaerae bacterium GWF2_45_14]|nr:MAG: hypothetical protein A2020_13805 [Lentisphaerae bacterium GWF2_45_14]